MEQTAAEGVHLNEVFSQVRSAVADVRAGLAHFERMLDAIDAGDRHVSRGYLDLVSALMLTGSVDVRYRGDYITVPLRRLSDWFRDPGTIAAERYEVDETTFRRWADHELSDGAGMIFLPCMQQGCRQTRMLTFYDPQEMQTAEAKAASGIWYCHHHRLFAWQSENALGGDHLVLLQRVRDFPGCNRQQLGAKKGETDFLVSIGLLLVQLPGADGSGRALSFHLTDVGQRIVRERSK
ncbi:hypothetical protein CFB50_15375 [Burkholderia sp. AU33423]|uniref:hypothetical protein n=1 Tax=Burkholderia sp. AU33423 TaxID=2015355 RepID=UPI000B7A8FA2|nr:hypothetical protein [Burkholderia sp. AU33423]OXI86004.1 hypothetical protein CFB50_15375 [Burkholderia sp. AU33423]